MADLVTRLLLNTQQFDANLGKSTRQIRGFEDKVKEFSAGAVECFNKFAGALGIAYGATELLQKGLNANATLQGRFNDAMQAGSTVVDQFFSSLYSGSWDYFNQGLITTIKNARELAGELRDATTMWQVMQSRYDRIEGQKTQDEAIVEDESLPLEERKAANERIQARLAEGRKEVARSIEETDKTIYDTVASWMGVVGDSSEASRANVQAELQKAGYGTDGEGLRRYIEDLRNGNSEFNDAVEKYEGARSESRNASALKAGAMVPGIIGTLSQVASQFVGDSSALGSYAESEKELLETASKVKGSLTDDNYEAVKELLDLSSEYNEKAGTWAKDMAGANETIAKAQQGVETATSASVSSGITKGAGEGAARMKAEVESMPPLKVPVEYVDARSVKEQYAVQARPERQDPYRFQSEDGFFADMDTGDLFKRIEENNEVLRQGAEENARYSESLAGISSVMGAVTNVVGEGAGAWLSYGTNIITAIAAAIPAIMTLTQAKKQETNAEIQNAAAKAAGSVAGIPFVGAIMAAAAIASVIAAFAAIPKFAEGGIVDGSSFYGDKLLARVNSGEMILNRGQQRSLFDALNGAETAGSVKFRIEGKELVGVLNAYGSKTGKFK